MAENFALAALISAVLSLGINRVVVRATDRTPLSDQRNDLGAVQAAHSRPTSRLGGLGVFTGFGAGSLLLSHVTGSLLPILLLISALPIFLAGILEDLGNGQSPRRRLLAAATSAVLAMGLSQTWVRETGVYGLDHLLAIIPMGLGLTVLWSTGVCNAFNLIDGVNGLSGFLASVISMALGYVAWTADDILMTQIAIVLAVAIAGFLIFNWPRGTIFLGDGGAYTIGHLLVWISVLICWRNREISYAALSLLFFWPVADTFLAMWRRSRRSRKMMHPDYLHVHQFVMRAIQLRWKLPLAQANPATTLVLAPFFLTPVLSAVCLVSQASLAFLAWLLFAILFTASYQVGIKQVRRQGWRRLGKQADDFVQPTE